MTCPVKLPPLPPIPWAVLGGIANDCVSAEAIHDYATAYAEQAVREALAAQVSGHVAGGVQVLHDHDDWFGEYGQTLGAFYNSLTIHTRAAWVAAAKKYAAMGDAISTEKDHGEPS